MRLSFGLCRRLLEHPNLHVSDFKLPETECTSFLTIQILAIITYVLCFLLRNSVQSQYSIIDVGNRFSGRVHLLQTGRTAVDLRHKRNTCRRSHRLNAGCFFMSQRFYVHFTRLKLPPNLFMLTYLIINSFN